MKQKFHGQVAVLQRVLPVYRAPFFDKLALSCNDLHLLSGEPRLSESIQTTQSLQAVNHTTANNFHFGKGKFYFCWQRGLLDWLESCSPDVLIVEANPRLLSTYSAIRYMKSCNRPVIGWGLGTLGWTSPSVVLALRSQWLKLFYGAFDALIAYSTKGARDYQKAGIPKERIFVAHNAVSNQHAEQLFQEVIEKPNLIKAWKGQIGLSDKPIILYVGRLVPEKRVDILIEACAPLSMDCQLVIVGDGPSRSMLEERARELLPETHFLGDRRGREAALCFAASDLFVLPGKGGLAVHEAMIYGKPIIVAAGDGTEEDLVRNGKNGFLVLVGDIATLSEQIRFCLANREIRLTLGQESRRVVTEEFSLDNMVESFLKALEFVAPNKIGS